MTEREYAKHRGCALNTVQVARKSGRLTKSVSRDARGRICVDPVAADAEWAANTKSDRVPLTGPTAPDESSATPDYGASRARREAAEAALAEIELAEKRRELVPAKDVESRLVEVFSQCRTKLMGVPSRARQQDPGLTADQIILIENLVREACEGLAS